MAALSDYLRLMRISLLPTAWSNVLAGFALTTLPIATRDQWMALPFLLLCSGCLYLCGMVMNDVYDYELDCVERPERVLPTGKVSLAAAKRLALILGLLGVLFSIAASALTDPRFMPTITAVGLLGLIWLYNRVAKGTMVGPLVMGLCRLSNILLGCSAISRAETFAGFDLGGWYVAGCLGLYVAGITLFATDEHASGSKRFLLSGAMIMAIALVLFGWFARTEVFSQQFLASHDVLPDPRHKFLFTGLLAMMAFPVIRNLFVSLVTRQSGQVKRTVIASLLTIIVLDASICYLVSPTTPAYALVTASLMIPAFLMSRKIMAT